MTDTKKHVRGSIKCLDCGATARDNFPLRHLPNCSSVEPTQLTDEQLRDLSALVGKMTPGPWMPEKAWAHANDETVHWSIRTVEKMPDTPWSPRYVAWMTGALINNVGASRIPYKFCEHCQHGYFKRREAAIEVRVDEQAEADVQAIVALRNAAPAMLETINALTRRVKLLRGEMASRELTEQERSQPFSPEEALRQANHWQTILDNGEGSDFALPETLREYARIRAGDFAIERELREHVLARKMARLAEVIERGDGGTKR